MKEICNTYRGYNVFVCLMSLLALVSAMFHWLYHWFSIGCSQRDSEQKMAKKQEIQRKHAEYLSNHIVAKIWSLRRKNKRIWYGLSGKNVYSSVDWSLSLL